MNALSALDFLRHPQSADDSDMKGAVECAISALEKQIPKKPIKIGEEYSVITRKFEAEYECASCGNPYIDDSFCSCCGQALDWSDTE